MNENVRTDMMMGFAKSVKYGGDIVRVKFMASKNESGTDRIRNIKGVTRSHISFCTA